MEGLNKVVCEQRRGRFEIMALLCLIVADRKGTHRGGHFPDTMISQRDARDRKDFN